MAEKKKFFREALEKYYKPSFIKKKDSIEPDFGDKVNNCIASFLKKEDTNVRNLIGLESIISAQPAKSVIILPSGCYTKMLESDDLELYKKCLSQFSGLTDQQILEIKTCVRPDTPKTCVLSPDVDFGTIGGYRYTNCCGQVINGVTDKTGAVQINDCVTKDTIEPYDDGKTKGADIKSIRYSDKPCFCEKVKQ